MHRRTALRPDRDITDPQLAKALAHPLRVAILGELEERTASPSDLAATLGAPVGNVSYHVRTLARLGLVKLVDTQPRRGAVEHYYRAEDRPVITSEAWSQVPTIVKQAMIRATLSQIADHVNGAAQSGGFERSDAHLTRSPVVLDARGWSELATRFDQLLKDSERIAAAAAQRLAKHNHHGEIHATAVLMLFETAQTDGPRPGPTSHKERSKRESRASR